LLFIYLFIYFLFSSNLLLLYQEKAATLTVQGADWSPESPIARISFSEPRAAGRLVKEQDLDAETSTVVVQYEGRGSQLHGVPGGAGETYLLRVYGSQQRVVVRSPLEHQLSKHMLPPVVKDTSKFLLCPMPGTLISCSESCAVL
jgi:hypothetical protein